MKKIILDCDPGMDDSMAIVLAAKSSEIDLLAVTAVNGNYPVDVTCTNALKVLEMLGKSHIPVYKGMAKPLVRESPKDPFTHGADGQADANLPNPATPPADGHAADAIINLVKKYPNEICLVATGPLSNLALAFVKAPEIKPLVAGIYTLSGAFGLNKYAFLNATGDTPQSEWNVYVDPEAADIVYNAGIPLIAVGLDVATHFDVNFSQADLTAFEKSKKREAWFLRNAVDFVNRRGFEAYCTVIDCMAVAAVIDPALISTMQVRVGVETKNGLTLGMTVVDRRHHHGWEGLPLIRIAENADYERFLRLVADLVLQ